LAGASVTNRSDAAPPHFPDEIHVPNGCFISTVAFVARFRAAFPAERAQPMVVELKKFYGLHTITVLSWRGEWWGRDEYFGVFALDRRVDRHPDPARLVGRAERALDEHAEDLVASGRARWELPHPRTLPASVRLHHLSNAAVSLPCPSERFWVAGGTEEVPLLFFRPLPGLVCVYDPATGTAQAETAATGAASIVRTFATGLGYPVKAIRADAAPSVTPQPARP
jgi:hypothetical protein